MTWSYYTTIPENSRYEQVREVLVIFLLLASTFSFVLSIYTIITSDFVITLFSTLIFISSLASISRISKIDNKYNKYYIFINEKGEKKKVLAK